MGTVRDVIRRNAVADLQLVQEVVGMPAVEAGPEGFLKFRSALYARR
jgi:hypothetical protein